jgi:sterol 3beta-glucosyltransferase
MASLSQQPSRSSTSGEDDSLNTDTDQPAISKLFADAALYDKYLVPPGDQDVYSNEGGVGSVAAFADLIAGGLDSPDKAIAGRLAKLSVHADSWISGELTSDPESYDTDSDTESFEPKPPSDDVSEPTTKEPASGLLRSSTMNSKKWRHSPEETVGLLVQEFGPLTQEGEEEKVEIEADAAFFHQDVAIVVCYNFCFRHSR